MTGSRSVIAIVGLDSNRSSAGESRSDEELKSLLRSGKISAPSFLGFAV